ncbi:hypothetical protein [Pseudoalteromonas ardens]|uniref:Uncharacterized protein n=1 Tax=Pseudoalteromonas rubra TaxID=43658 RepID=A0A0L0EP23_9GAMM|nr:hypothetical protein [Pseudoalteromonas sp. R96]KNC65653.1 hypothetical protein AC626_21800 [Pseudoalteromonas rubra]MDK1311036.1 hypothetical protein [Pseudoalteromonas sp. R96]
MIKAPCLILLYVLSGLTGCSSAPERNYQVNTYQRQASAWLAQGDRKRQQGAYQQALQYYDNAYRYASKRHDVAQMGLARLKQAAVYIKQGQGELAEGKIAQAAEFVRFEHTELAPAIDFMRSKLAFSRGEQAQAQALLSKLQAQYSEQPEKQVYYRWVGWQYTPQRLDWLQAEQDMQLLAQMKADRTLNNIEILSFVIYHNVLWRVTFEHHDVPQAIETAIAHFASLELTNRLVDCFEIAVQHYLAIGDTARAQYYQTRLAELTSSGH